VAKRKAGPLIWILGGIGAIFLLIVILVAGAGLFIAHKAKTAGFDTELAQRNPTLAAAKVMAAMNPNVEIVSMDEDRGTLTLREKKTGKTVTINANDMKEGKLTFSDESTGQHVTFGADSAAKLPDWVPSYPGSKPEGTFSASGNEGESGMAHFETSDAGSKVLDFYQDKLKDAGFKITSTFNGDSGDSRGGIVTAEDAANRRNVMVTVRSTANGTEVALTYGTKK